MNIASKHPDIVKRLKILALERQNTRLTEPVKTALSKYR